LLEWLPSRTRTTNFGEDVGKKEPFPFHLWECKFIQPLWKTIWRFFKKLKINLPYNSSNTTPGDIPKAV
jgi:hypothetical protein